MLGEPGDKMGFPPGVNLKIVKKKKIKFLKNFLNYILIKKKNPEYFYY